jgi:hypothetical protein
MKMLMVFFFPAAFSFFHDEASSQRMKHDSTPVMHHRIILQQPKPKNMYIDVYHFGSGSVTSQAMATSYLRDQAMGKKYGVHFLKYWMDRTGGNVYFLSVATDSQSVLKTHAEAHGKMPDEIFHVTDGLASPLNNGKTFFIDVHELGAGKVTAEAVVGVHQKDLAVEKKYGVNLINYWVDEKKGVVMCLSQAADSADVLKTHREAHGLMPAYIVRVDPGQ